MSRQEPKPIEEVEKRVKEDRKSGWSGGNSVLGNGIRLRRRRLPGETAKQARARFAREDQMQDDRERDPSYGQDGRRLPVRYE